MNGKISNFQQVASVRRYTYTEGVGKDLDVIDCDNGKLRFLINVSKACDIMQIYHEGQNVSFVSKNGFTKREIPFLNRFEGGMLYTLGDFAFAAIANYLHPATVTQGGQISYIRAAYTSTITAKAREIVRSGHNCVCEVEIYNDKNEIVCVCTFNGFIKEIPQQDWKWTMQEKKV